MIEPEDAHAFGPRDIAVAAMINLMWGMNLIAGKIAVSATAPFTTAAIRQTIVLAACAPFLRIVPGRMPALLVSGAVMGAGYLIVTNLSLLVSTNVAPLAIAGQLGVPFSLVLAVVLLGERIAWRRLVALVCTFGGVVLLLFDPAIVDEVPGLLLSVLGALLWAIGSLQQRRLVGVPVLTIYAWVGFVGAVVMIPLALLIEPATVAALPHAPPLAFAAIVFSAIGSTVLGQGGMAWLLQRHPVATVTPLILAVPLIAVIAARLMFGTPLTPLMLLGGMIVMTGVVTISLRSARRPQVAR